MTLWVILTLLVTAASLFLASPFLRGDRNANAGDAAAGIDVFREQLAELDREAAEGRIDAEQAKSAQLEIKRRVLTLQRDNATPVRKLSLIEQKFFAWVAAAVVALGGTLLYAMNGNPDVPSAMRTAAVTAEPRAGGPTAAPSAIATPSATDAGPQAVSPGLSSVDDMVERLAQRLAKSPNDADGWRMLGWSYFRTDRYQEAATAYAKASALQPEVGALKTAWAEALVRAANGKVSPQALSLSEEAIKLDAKDPRARYFLGLAKEQAGDAKGAIDVWIALLSDATAADDWAAEVRQQTIALAKEKSIDIESRLPKSPEGPGILGKIDQKPAQGDRAPSEADVKAAEALSAADRDKMIRGMVDGLQARLDTNPRDAEGWIKLVKSRAVLGERDKARAALDRVAEVFANAPAERDRILAAAREAGIAP